MIGPTKGAVRAAGVILGGDKSIDTEYGRKSVIGLARLIDSETAAPDLLKVCKCADADIKGLLECMDDSTAYDFPTHAAEQTRMEIEAAIAKAEARE